jgi:hypothetical protein
MPKYLIVFALLVLCAGVSQAQENNFKVELEKRSSDVPDSTNFSPQYPNPFCPVTDLNFNIKERCNSRVDLYDVEMKFIATLLNEEMDAGKYEIKWNPTELKSGIYYYKLTAGSTTDTKKIVLVK